MKIWRSTARALSSSRGYSIGALQNSKLTTRHQRALFSIMPALQRSAILEAIQQHDPQSTSVVHSQSGRSFTYGSLLHDVVDAKQRLLRQTDREDRGIAGERIAFLVENGYDYVVTFLALLASNAIAVPLSPSHPSSELRYIINHSQALALLSSAKFDGLAQNVLSEGLDQTPITVRIEKLLHGSTSNAPLQLGGDAKREAIEGGLMLYTSGTTARPKGVLLPQAVLMAQAKSLLKAWEYSPRDRLLHVLPLHHIHGTVNAMLTPLLAGSSVEYLFPFNADQVWRRLAAPFMPAQDRPEHLRKAITFLTAVPTIWSRLLQSFSSLPDTVQAAAKQAIQRKNLRLNISGSAALPTPIKTAWTELSQGNVLLERYGMTEVGMALSCGLDDADRIDGSVGWPLPGVEARLVDTDTNEVLEPGIGDQDVNGKERSGEIQLRGPTIFKAYWRNPEATAKEFTQNGWFKTGDIAVRKSVPGAGEGRSGSWACGPAFFIHGRKSADIIKTGGEKVSALEIERELLSLPEVEECAVVGLPSEAWGQKVAAVVVLTAAGLVAGKNEKPWGPMDMRRALKDRLAPYKIPQDLQIVETLPRNAMGKINKKELVASVFGDNRAIRRRSIAVAEERANSKRSQ